MKTFNLVEDVPQVVFTANLAGIYAVTAEHVSGDYARLRLSTYAVDFATTNPDLPAGNLVPMGDGDTITAIALDDDASFRMAVAWLGDGLVE
jgi:hypothetical protein